LIGEHVMQNADPAAALRALRMAEDADHSAV
jgi:hypothetical protein